MLALILSSSSLLEARDGEERRPAILTVSSRVMLRGDRELTEFAP